MNKKLCASSGGEGVTLHEVYEASPTGYMLYRRLQQLKIACILVGPTKTPLAKGVRQKNDKRDAIMLARVPIPVSCRE